METIGEIYSCLPLWLQALCLLVALGTLIAAVGLVVRYRLKRLAHTQQTQFSAVLEHFVDDRDAAALTRLATRQHREQSKS